MSTPAIGSTLRNRETFTDPDTGQTFRAGTSFVVEAIDRSYVYVCATDGRDTVLTDGEYVKD